MRRISSSQELFTWLLAVNADSKDPSAESDGVRALWSWTIRSHMPYRSVHSGSSQSHHGKDGLDEVKGKFTTRFDVLKDEVQSVFPIIKVRQLAIHLKFSADLAHFWELRPQTHLQMHFPPAGKK